MRCAASPVLAQGVDEQRFDAAVAGVQDRVVEQAGAEPALAGVRQHRHAELGHAPGPSIPGAAGTWARCATAIRSRRAIDDAEHLVAFEVDRFDIALDLRVARLLSRSAGSDRAAAAGAGDRQCAGDGPRSACGSAPRSRRFRTPVVRRPPARPCEACWRRAGRDGTARSSGLFSVFRVNPSIADAAPVLAGSCADPCRLIDRVLWYARRLFRYLSSPEERQLRQPAGSDGTSRLRLADPSMRSSRCSEPGRCRRVRYQEAASITEAVPRCCGSACHLRWSQSSSNTLS